jgi:MFS family permease
VGGPKEPKPPRLGLLRPLGRRDFRLLWSGMTVSLLGDGIYFVAVAWLVLQISGAPSALSLVGVAWTLPQVVFLLAGGVVTDRFDRRRVLIVSDLVRGASIGAIGLLALSGNVELWHVFSLVAVYGAAEGFFMPAFTAIVPDVVDKAMLVEANALDQFVRPLTLRFAGPAIGGFVIASAGVGEAFLLDAATFVVSAVFVALMARHPREKSESHVSALTEVREGFSYVRSHPWLWISLLAAATGLLAFYGPFQVLVPFLVEEELSGSASDLGIVFAVGGIGSIGAALVLGQTKMPRRHITVAYLCWGIGTLTMATFAMANRVWQAALITFSMQFLFTAGTIIWTSLLQTRVPGRLLGRVSSLDWLVSGSLIPLSYGLTGPLAETLGTQTTFVLAALVGGAVVLGALLVPSLHDLEREPSGAV